MPPHPLHAAATRGALVLLYHSVGDDFAGDYTPPGLHHVSVSDFSAHLDWVAQHFEFMALDDLISLPHPHGKAALCFDDGHRNVFEQALPVAEARGIPFSCFINGASLQGALLWREKLRHILSLHLEDELARSLPHLHNPDNKRFYRYSKHPSNDSRTVERALDRFLHEHNITPPPSAMLHDPRPYASHPLIHWGNHSHHHYVMSSLDDAAQHQEIAATAATMKQLGLRPGTTFALPFGAPTDATPTTFHAAAAHGAHAIALSRNRLHNGTTDPQSGLAIVERFMPRGNDPGCWAGIG